jgi:hypothetical protein
VGTTDSHRGEHKNKQYWMSNGCTTQRQADRGWPSNVFSCGNGRIPLQMLASLEHCHAPASDPTPLPEVGEVEDIHAWKHIKWGT